MIFWRRRIVPLFSPNILLIPNLNKVTDKHGEIYFEFTDPKPLIQQWKNNTRIWSLWVPFFGKKKKEPFSIAFGILKHPVYGFLNNFLPIMTTSYRTGVDQFRGWADLAQKKKNNSDFGFWGQSADWRILNAQWITAFFNILVWMIYFVFFEVRMAEINSAVSFDFFSAWP